MTGTAVQFEMADRPDSPRRETTGARAYRVSLAEGAAQRAAVHRLRHRIFSEEYGASMSGPDGLDIDEFDDTCDHLMIWHGPRDDETLVATCRLLAPHRRSRDGRSALYTATEFDLTPVAELLPMTVEVGRTCVVPEERSGAAISLVWGGIARYVLLTGNRYLLGCASVSLADGGANASAIATELAITTGSSRVLPCLPRHPFPVDDRARAGIKALAPPLLRGYLRLGAQVGSNPAWDQDFGAADFPVLLDYQQVPDRYLTHFLGVGG